MGGFLTWWRRGSAFVWLTGGTLAFALLMISGLVGFIAWKGLGFFWPSPLVQLQTAEGPVLGVVQAREAATAENPAKVQLRVGNRDLYGQDFRWIEAAAIQAETRPSDAVLVERKEYGAFLGRVRELRRDGRCLASGPEALERLLARTPDPACTLVLESAEGQLKELPAAELVRLVAPNRLGVIGKARVYAARLWEFVAGNPRESNTEGGIFPALFGTVMMVLLMSLTGVPLGVLAALYLREYARQGWMVRLLRVAVNNLAGVPSIVFGIFGLGFFVYAVGGSLDRLFFAERLPTPTFGTGGILWASLTLALLTVPVVIVATEEALAAVPRSQREASLALGATKWQTLRKVVLPGAAPGILTGLILAMARGAGEVAPLMLTGVVKLAPSMPLDGQFPFLHLDRKFMHLGFHIYDVGFQSPNSEAAKPMVFMTALLLLLVVVSLNLAALRLRNHLRARAGGSTF